MSAEKTAAVLAAHQWRGWRNEYFGDGEWRRNFHVCACGSDWSFAHQAAMLEPVIREREAVALEDAAECFGENQSIREGDVKEWLRLRAAGIREGKQ